ncbi:MAG: glycosyltransferase, partial [Armatimonadota bacterium]|nr:glycosyltransferase [Armatimonadota bacterium]
TLEALACGTAVIGTPVGATPELLSQLGNEFLFNGCDAAALANGILRMREELSRRGVGIRANCRRLVETGYTWAAAVERLEDVLYEEIRRNLKAKNRVA